MSASKSCANAVCRETYPFRWGNPPRHREGFMLITPDGSLLRFCDFECIERWIEQEHEEDLLVIRRGR